MWFLYKAKIKMYTSMTVETGSSVRDTILDIGFGIKSGRYKLKNVRILEIEDEKLVDNEGRTYDIRGEI